jgi:hypothetical protein
MYLKEIVWYVMDCIDPAQNSDQLGALTNKVMNLRLP